MTVLEEETKVIKFDKNFWEKKLIRNTFSKSLRTVDVANQNSDILLNALNWDEEKVASKVRSRFILSSTFGRLSSLPGSGEYTPNTVDDTYFYFYLNCLIT